MFRAHPKFHRRRFHFESLENRNLMANLAAGDFNGDGKDDMAVGFALEDVGAIVDAGAVNVIYGSSTGLTPFGNQFWNQNSAGVQETAETGDGFGNEVATGDFNGDGKDDLLIGVPEEGIGAKRRAGAVQVLYGSSAGLVATGNRLFHQDQAGVPGTSVANDLFGVALATGDFNNDGFDDAAIGAPGDGGNIGSVTVILGSATGLKTTGTQWSQATPSIQGDPEEGDRFGSSLATGDVNNDGFDDLAVGVPSEDSGRGLVHVIFGSVSGLTASGNQLFGLSGALSDFGDGFGTALTIGDFNGDQFGDLVVGIPGWDRNGVESVGAVNVFRGSATGLDNQGILFLTQETLGVPDDSDEFDSFGNTLTSGDFNLDGKDDLVVGAPFEAVGTVQFAGAMTVIPGTSAGPTGAGSKQWTQNSSGILDVAEQFDLLAFPVVGNFNGDTRTDLAIFALNESVGTIQGAGAVNVIYSKAIGLSSLGNQLWNQDSPGILDQAEANDSYDVNAAARESRADAMFSQGYDMDIVNLRKSRRVN